MCEVILPPSAKTHMMNSTRSDTARIHCLGCKVDIICIRTVTNNKWSRLCKKSAVLQSGACIKILPLNKKLIVVLKKEGKHTDANLVILLQMSVGNYF